MKLVTYVGPDNGAFSLDVGDHGAYAFDPANGLLAVTMSDEAAAIVATSQPYDFTISDA